MDDIDIKSPIFKPKPGWGGKLKNFAKKHFYSVVLPAIAIAAILIGINLFSQKVMEGQTAQNTLSQDMIEKTASQGQGVAHLAREALSDYLSENPDISLLPQQKIFVETYFIDKFGNKEISAGEKIDFKKEDLAKATAKAKTLTPEQLSAWSKYIPKQEL